MVNANPQVLHGLVLLGAEPPRDGVVGPRQVVVQRGRDASCIRGEPARHDDGDAEVLQSSEDVIGRLHVGRERRIGG
eukprot:7153398-Prymnesium_polylepis.6